MELIYKEDLNICFGAQAIRQEVFSGAKELVQVFHLPDLVGQELVSDIRNLVRPEETELNLFWKDFVRPYAAWKCYEIILQTHGFTVAAQGIIKFNDSANINQAASAKERGDMIKQAGDYAMRYEQIMMNKLEQVEWTFDGKTYTSKKHKIGDKPQAGINAIGNRSFIRSRNVL